MYINRQLDILSRTPLKRKLTQQQFTMRLRFTLTCLLTFSLQDICFPFYQNTFTVSTQTKKATRKRYHGCSVLKDSKQASTCPDESLSREEISRYSRHLVLSVSIDEQRFLVAFVLFSICTHLFSYLFLSEKDVGMKGQKALKNSSVLVVGAGGLGSPCLL